MATKSKSKKAPQGLSEGTKKIILVATGCVMLVGASYWAYMTFTTVPPPPLATATPKEVVKFLGDSRGYPRMRMAAREEYLAEAYQQFADGPSREEMARAFAQMTTREKETFVNTSFEAFKVRFLESANEYNRLPRNKRDQFVDNMINTFQQQRQSVAGAGGDDNLAESFKGLVPSTTDGMMKAVVARTTSRQRAEAQPLFDHAAARYQQLRDSGKLR